MLQEVAGEKKPVWFVFSGMGSQWPGMGRDLMVLEPFSKAINKCADILKPEGIDLIKIIMNSDNSTFDNVLNSFVSIAAIQVGTISNTPHYISIIILVFMGFLLKIYLTGSISRPLVLCWYNSRWNNWTFSW